jgi:methylated-DNA-[protein]-cysteine S-methyltransferase
MSTPLLVTHDTPIGRLTLAASDQGLTRATPRRPGTPPHPGTPSSPAERRWLDQARRELDEYFAGARREFDVPVDLRRVDRPARRILEYLAAQVGYGRTTTYGAIAAALGLTEDGPRTVGAAMARNPVMIIVGCHRVLGADGRLTGYAGGLPAKRRLLDLESQDLRPQLALALTDHHA